MAKSNCTQTTSNDQGLKRIKIFERRQEAKELKELIEFSEGLLSDLMSIDPESTRPRIRFSGEDQFGNSAKAETGLYPNVFNDFRAVVVKVVAQDVINRKKWLSEIPDAPVIPVDFQTGKVDPDMDYRPKVQPKIAPHMRLPAGHEVIIVGGWAIAKFVGIKYRQVAAYVQEKELPAFKMSGRRRWYAFEDDLFFWKRRLENGTLKGGSHE